MRCLGCGHRRPLEISYTIEDLDTLDQAQQAARAQQMQSRPEMRKYRSFLSPDDALRDLRKHASQGAEIRWELHTSRTDVDLASRTRCSCHSLTPREDKPRHPERGDLRKHHSAETDKWSLKPDTEHDLRKHLSDDSRMDREHRWTLQVPEVHANPKQRCTCPKPPLVFLPSPAASDHSSRRPSPRPSPFLGRGARSLTPDLPMPQYQHKRLSGDSRSSRERSSVSPVPTEQPPQPQQPAPAQPPAEPPPRESAKSVKESKQSKRERERAQPSEARRAIRTKWAVKPHFSLPAERKDSKWVKPHDDYKSKSLKERPKYSVRRSMSPDPDPRQVLRVDNRVVRRLISPEVSIMDAKWAPYEGYSPLPNVGMKKRETKKISDIKWVPYDESPMQPKPPEPEVTPPEELADPPQDWSPFHNITPPHLPPPAASPSRDAEEEFRMRCLNQVTAFPIYQGAWREESPPPTPPPPDLSTPVWSPLEPAQLRRQSTLARPSLSPPPSPPPAPKRATLKVRSSRKKASRAKSQESTRVDERQRQPSLLAPPPLRGVLSRTSSEEPKRQRPQLLRSKALFLDVPHIDATKRSLSEEVRSYNKRSESTKRGFMSRAKSEDAARYGDPWLSNDDDDGQELREYVTTV